MKALFHPHAGIGYLVLLLGLIILIWALADAYRDEEKSRKLHYFCTGYVGLLDLQALLGIILFFQLGRGWDWYLHPLFMIAAAIAAHVANKQKSWAFVGGILIVLVLLLAGAYPVVLNGKVFSIG